MAKRVGEHRTTSERRDCKADRRDFGLPSKMRSRGSNVSTRKSRKSSSRQPASKFTKAFQFVAAFLDPLHRTGASNLKNGPTNAKLERLALIQARWDPVSQ